MDRLPNFFIVAGPNGAGKSTYGHIFVPESVSIFNGDLVFADLVKRYSHIEPERLQGGVAKALEDSRDKALASKADFAFESNYSSDMASEIAQQFREAGYKTTLIYFGLDNLKFSGLRVSDRYTLGGHNVSPEVIKYNFEEGIKRVNKDLHLFDQVLFVDSRNQNTRIIGLLQKETQKQLSITKEIDWYKTHFEDTVKKLYFSKKQVQQIKINTPNRRKGLRR